MTEDEMVKFVSTSPLFQAPPRDLVAEEFAQAAEDWRRFGRAIAVQPAETPFWDYLGSAVNSMSKKEEG